MISAYIIRHFTTYMHLIMYSTLPLVKATWTKWPVSFSPTLPYPNSLKEGVGGVVRHSREPCYARVSDWRSCGEASMMTS